MNANNLGSNECKCISGGKCRVHNRTPEGYITSKWAVKRVRAFLKRTQKAYDEVAQYLGYK